MPIGKQAGFRAASGKTRRKQAESLICGAPRGLFSLHGLTRPKQPQKPWRLASPWRLDDFRPRPAPRRRSLKSPFCGAGQAKRPEAA